VAGVWVGGHDSMVTGLGGALNAIWGGGARSESGCGWMAQSVRRSGRGGDERGGRNAIDSSGGRRLPFREGL
jgi:hypothetical protein